MQIELSVEQDNSVSSNLWRGLVTLRNGKDSLTIRTDNRSQSPNGSWDEVIKILQRAIDKAEQDAAMRRAYDC